MSSQNYKDFFEEAIKQIREEMNENNQSDEFTLWFNMDYVEDTLSQITVSVSSEFMWIQMNSKKYVQRLEDKINELTGQQISITHIVKNKQTFQFQKKNLCQNLKQKRLNQKLFIRLKKNPNQLKILIKSILN